MPVAVRSRPDEDGHVRPGGSAVSALFWRLFAVSGAVFIAGTAVLVLSPATVSAPVAVT